MIRNYADMTFPRYENELVLNITFLTVRTTKDSMVIGCFAGMMLDVSIFDDPLNFRPDRFYLDGKIVIPDQYHPFGVGKHRCMGEIMARSNLFLFITTLLQNFTFTVPPGHQMPSPEPLDGATPSVCEYTALITAR